MAFPAGLLAASRTGSDTVKIPSMDMGLDGIMRDYNKKTRKALWLTGFGVVWDGVKQQFGERDNHTIGYKPYIARIS